MAALTFLFFSYFPPVWCLFLYSNFIWERKWEKNIDILGNLPICCRSRRLGWEICSISLKRPFYGASQQYHCNGVRNVILECHLLLSVTSLGLGPHEWAQILINIIKKTSTKQLCQPRPRHQFPLAWAEMWSTNITPKCNTREWFTRGNIKTCDKKVIHTLSANGVLQ